MAKIKGVDLFATFSNTVAQKEAKTVPPADSPDGTMDAVFDGISPTDAKALSAWCVRYQVGPEDVVWGQILATRISFDSMQAARQAAEAVQAGVGRIQGEILAGARAAGKDVAHEIEAAGKRVNEGISQHLQAPGNGILASIKSALETGAGQGLLNTKDDLRQVQAEASAIIDGLPEKIRQAIDAAERVSAEEFRQAAQGALERFSRQASKIWMAWGGFLTLLAVSAGIGYGYILGSNAQPWWSHSFASIFLGAPTGIVLFPVAGFAFIEGGKAYNEYSRMRPALIWIGVSLAVSGLVLPILGHYVH